MTGPPAHLDHHELTGLLLGAFVVTDFLRGPLGLEAARGRVVPRLTTRIAGHVGAAHGGFVHAAPPDANLNGENRCHRRSARF